MEMKSKTILNSTLQWCDNEHAVSIHQSGTKPNLVAKILATNFGVFFVIYVMFSKNMFNVGLIIMW